MKLVHGCDAECYSRNETTHCIKTQSQFYAYINSLKASVLTNSPRDLSPISLVKVLKMSSSICSINIRWPASGISSPVPDMAISFMKKIRNVLNPLCDELFWWYIDGLVKDCSISSVIAKDLLQSCTKQSIWIYHWILFNSSTLKWFWWLKSPLMVNMDLTI